MFWPFIEFSAVICRELSPSVTIECGIAAMKRLEPKRISCVIRSLLLIGVLLTLCTAEGVGLHLFPLPPNADQSRLSEKAPCFGSASHSTSTPLEDVYIPGRVEIAAPKLKQSLVQQSLSVITPSPIVTAEFQDTPLPSIYPERVRPAYSFVFARRPAGRAPPTLA